MNTAFHSRVLLVQRKTAFFITDLLILGLLSFSFNPFYAKKIDNQTDIPMTKELWQYLRKGLNYLETSGRQLPPSFVHPGGKAFGALGLSQAAVQDVIKNSPALSGFSPQEVFRQQAVYEEVAKNYADLLLRHYLGMDYRNMPAAEVFMVLEKAWFLGPGLYKKGNPVLLSREERAREYIDASCLTNQGKNF
jgi:hypothetical protein